MHSPLLRLSVLAVYGEGLQMSQLRLFRNVQNCQKTVHERLTHLKMSNMETVILQSLLYTEQYKYMICHSYIATKYP